MGDFEQLVLLACVRLGSEGYAVPILEEIETRTGRRASQAAVYVALRRLEKRGLVTSALGEPTSERGGRAKRYFRPTPEALRLLRESREAFRAMWRGVEARVR